MVDFLLENSNHRKHYVQSIWMTPIYGARVWVTVPYTKSPCWALVWHHGQAGVDQWSASLTRCLSHQLVSTKMLLGYRRLEWRQDTRFSWRQYLEKEITYFNIFKRRFITILSNKRTKHSIPNFSNWLHSFKRDFTKQTTPEYHKSCTGYESHGSTPSMTWNTA